MSIKAVLFDLDGTLLPMEQEIFVKAYFSLLAKRLAAHGYESEKLIGAIWQGTASMVKNSGEKTNEAVFWDTFSAIFGEKARQDEPYFEAFYREEFDKVSVSCGYTEEALAIVRFCQAKGYEVILATNPIFPAIATQKRIKWAGLSSDDFSLVTTYENSHSCKPNLSYYTEILNKRNLKAEECLMVGNDVSEDMVAEKLGMQVFLLTNCLINKSGEEIARYPHGDFNALLDFIRKHPA